MRASWLAAAIVVFVTLVAASCSSSDPEPTAVEAPNATILGGAVAAPIRTSSHPCARTTSGTRLIDELWISGVFPENSLLIEVARYPDADSAAIAASSHVMANSEVSGWAFTSLAAEDGVSEVEAVSPSGDEVLLVLSNAGAGWAVLGSTMSSISFDFVRLRDGSVDGFVVSQNESDAQVTVLPASESAVPSGEAMGSVTLVTAAEAPFSFPTQAEAALVRITVGAETVGGASGFGDFVLSETLTCRFVAAVLTSEAPVVSLSGRLERAGAGGTVVLAGEAAEALILRYVDDFAGLEGDAPIGVGAVLGDTQAAAVIAALRADPQISAAALVETQGRSEEPSGDPWVVDDTVSADSAPKPTVCIQPPAFGTVPNMEFTVTDDLDAASTIPLALERFFREATILPPAADRLVMHWISDGGRYGSIEDDRGFRSSVLRLAEVVNEGWRVTDWAVAAC